MGKIMESGLQYAVNACQNAIVNGDQKLLSQMFCDDKESQANAKRIKNRWNKLSWSDKQILRKNISKDLRANRIRYAVKVGADDRCYLLLSAQIRYTMTGHTIHFHVWDAAMSEEHRENFEQNQKLSEDELAKGKNVLQEAPGFRTVLMRPIQMRQILPKNIDGKAIDGDGEWLFHYFSWLFP